MNLNLTLTKLNHLYTLNLLSLNRSTLSYYKGLLTSTLPLLSTNHPYRLMGENVLFDITTLLEQ